MSNNEIQEEQIPILTPDDLMDLYIKLEQENKKLREALDRSLSYLEWKEDDLIGDDLKGDGRLTASYKDVILKIKSALYPEALGVK